ncbi:myo-inositol-1-monophosphatase [Xaviernesmea oryzae]|uniref:Inositol-1-monophosphatase n=1 Tax=Xaviernesmea oryzae TaxID=464029 RepID=A0A1Q9ATX3_9HYPH|nr:inositol monophosphatase family protein [Xaviernesmea oryzae]OLP58879.1 myo-inositol-1-monophosphatase [Xaviernesmea oryzae]SEM03080.1 myo-inositol-1(or 4)-monophosphatase [Xaviernesmea oryzae]
MSNPHLGRLSAASMIIEEAATIALTFFESRDRIATRTKAAAQDFVSEADTAVETFIREKLAAAFPGETVCGEEFGGAADEAYWIIDPIDGTSNFLRGSPLWGISLGFVRAGRPELGVVAMPAEHRLYAAADGTGLFCNGAALKRPEPIADIRVVSLGDHPQEDFEAAARFQVGLRQAEWIVEGFHSTSVSLVYAARGIFDGHLQTMTTMWDIAGGAVLAREAGLDVRIGRNRDGHEWIAAGTPTLLSAVEPLWPEIAG